MAFWRNVLKKEQKRKDTARSETAPVSPRPAGDAEIASPPMQAGASSYARILRSPHITEKTARAGETGTYAFKVSPYANKNTVKQAVERRYGVGVARVRILQTPAHARVRGNIVGWKPGFKKAMVTLKSGERIDIQ